MSNIGLIISGEPNNANAIRNEARKMQLPEYVPMNHTRERILSVMKQCPIKAAVLDQDIEHEPLDEEFLQLMRKTAVQKDDKPLFIAVRTNPLMDEEELDRRKRALQEKLGADFVFAYSKLEIGSSISPVINTLQIIKGHLGIEKPAIQTQLLTTGKPHIWRPS
jgi:hypothetical protein